MSIQNRIIFASRSEFVSITRVIDCIELIGFLNNLRM